MTSMIARAWLALPLPDSEHPLRLYARAFFRSYRATFGAILLTLIVMAALAAPWIAPQNPYDLRSLSIFDNVLEPGSALANGMIAHLGTDEQGRDMLSAILYGLRISLVVAVTAIVLAAVIGASVGVCAAYASGRIEALLMRIVDLQLSFPAILVALVLLAIFGRGVDKVIIALVVVKWAYFARTVRGSAVVEMRREYIEAAKSLGLTRWRVVFRHLLPNCLPPLIVVATVQIANAVAIEASLSFLGVGVPVTEPSLGMLISGGYHYMLSGKYWISTFPGLALVVLVVAINLVGDRLREVLNPRFDK